MNQHTRLLTGLLAAALLGAAGYAGYQAQARRAATLARIAALETRMAAHNRQAALAAIATINSVEYYDCLNHHHAQDLQITAMCRQIKARTQALADTLQALRQQLRTAAGEAALGTLRHPGTMAESRPTTIARLTRQLAHYTAFIEADSPKPSPLAQAIADDRLAQSIDGRIPLGAVLAALTHLETQLWLAGTAALQTQALRTGRTIDWYDCLLAFPVAASTTIAPGEVYQARLFLINTDLHYCTTLSADKQLVAAGRDSIAFRVLPRPPGQPGAVLARWRGAIQAWTNPEGAGHSAQDTTWRLEVPYSIVESRTR